jgi:hypothetical protein
VTCITAAYLWAPVKRMPLEKLSIFSKNTDANATIKGYEYQKLRTLEIWLEIFL